MPTTCSSTGRRRRLLAAPSSSTIEDLALSFAAPSAAAGGDRRERRGRGIWARERSGWRRRVAVVRELVALARSCGDRETKTEDEGEVVCGVYV
jgi:hypothetical protein